jgi:hypothetical protein
MSAKCDYLDPVALRETLAGYALADEVIGNERADWLERLTPDESRAIFRTLWRVWTRSAPDGDLAALDRLKVEELVERRHRMDCLAAGYGPEVHNERPA